MCDWVDVDRVIDGDTIAITVDGVEEHVRYVGMDTPEFDEPLGDTATERNEELLSDSDSEACLERDVSERDQYGRLLRYVWLRDGRMADEVLVEEGLATVVTFPPDVKYHEARLLPAEERARAAGIGVWAR